MAKLDDVLNNSLREVETELDNRLNTIRDSIKQKNLKANKKLTSKMERLEAIKVEMQSLTDEESKIKTEIKNLDPILSQTEKDDLQEKYPWLINKYRDVRKSEADVAIKIATTKERNNIQAFKQIKEQTINQFNLAINNKQKQQVILNFQNMVDWKSLGINMPNMFEISNIEIKGWKIIIDNALPSKIK